MKTFLKSNKLVKIYTKLKFNIYSIVKFLKSKLFKRSKLEFLKVNSKLFKIRAKKISKHYF